MVWVAIDTVYKQHVTTRSKTIPWAYHPHTDSHKLISSLEQNFIDLGSNLHLVVAMKNYNLSWSGFR